MVHGRQLLDPEPDHGARGEGGADVRRQGFPGLLRRADGLPDQGHEPDIQGAGVDVDLVDALADPEGHGLQALVEKAPVATPARLQAAPPEDERTLVLVGELVVGIEPAVHPHVAPTTRNRERSRRFHPDRGRDGEEPADAHAGPVGAQEKRADRDRDKTGGDHDEGAHGRGW